jgi:hypothetical protein
MARGGWSLRWRHAVNGLFALAIPLGIALFYIGLTSATAGSPLVSYALAFSAGTFLCISLSDLLPELQFHDHDRVKLSVALVLGLALAIAVGKLEGLVHRHPIEQSVTAEDVESAESQARGTALGREMGLAIGREAAISFFSATSAPSAVNLQLVPRLNPLDDAPVEPALIGVAISASNKAQVPAPRDDGNLNADAMLILEQRRRRHHGVVLSGND